MNKIRIIRTSTVPLSLKFLLKGQLAFLNRHFDVTAVSGEGPDLETVKLREGVRVYPVEMQRQISPFRDLVSLVKLYIYFKRTKPALVHSITPKAGLLSMAAAWFARVPVRIHTFTGLIFPSKKGKMQKLLILMDRLLCYFATDIFPEGKGVMEDLKKFEITNKPLKIIANGNVNGIDLEFFSPQNITETIQTDLKSRLNICENDFVFIFVGRLVKDKGINELVAAFKQLKSSSDTVNPKLLLVGPFEQELDPLLPETLKEIESNDNIISVGFQEDVRPYFAIADALVFPSYREGFPNVVMQAGAMELPSVVSNINGCNEIILEGENGIIIPAKNQEELHAAMARLISDRYLYSNLKNNSRKMIQQRYEQSVVWEALLKEYHHLLKKANA